MDSEQQQQQLNPENKQEINLLKAEVKQLKETLVDFVEYTKYQESKITEKIQAEVKKEISQQDRSQEIERLQKEVLQLNAKLNEQPALLEVMKNFQTEVKKLNERLNDKPAVVN